MSDMGCQIFADNGDIIWDSRNVVGGVVADVLFYAANATGTKSYPIFRKEYCNYKSLRLERNCRYGVTLDNNLGYPRITVAAVPQPRNFIFMVW